jgi:hypothetical protein
MDWANHGVKIVHSDALDLNTPQTSGMTRMRQLEQASSGTALWLFNQMPNWTASSWRTGDRPLRGKSAALILTADPPEPQPGQSLALRRSS